MVEPTRQMSEITEQLRNEIEALDLRPSYEEPICMQQVSKDLAGEFVVEQKEQLECAEPPCVTLKGWLTFRIDVTPHRRCDAVPAFDGKIQGELVFAYINDGHGRGYHLGKFEWFGSASTLMGRMSGVTNAGTHRAPATAACEDCDPGGHMEGRLDAVVVEGEHQGCRVLATYVIDFDAGTDVQDTGLRGGTLEGVSICPCEG
jgi:hypothetical protein